jgi:Fic family protein
MGRVLDAALRLTAAVPGQVEVFGVAPLQALAHLHAVVAHGFVDDDHLGRPRAFDSADDPLHLGPLPPAGAASARLAGLADLLTRTSEAPALVVAAIAHAEIASARPFSWGSGLLARATVRLVIASRGVDPSLFSIPEHGMFEMGRPAYVAALRAYATGTAAGVSEYIAWHSTALAMGAKAVSPPTPA